MREVIALGKATTPQGDIKEQSDAASALALETAQQALMEELKSERDKLIEHFDKDTDLKHKIIITGVK